MVDTPFQKSLDPGLQTLKEMRDYFNSFLLLIITIITFAIFNQHATAAAKYMNTDTIIHLHTTCILHMYIFIYILSMMK
jgi:hypothetical protein